MVNQVTRTAFPLTVEPAHREYLVQQKGKLDEFKDQPKLWHRMYVDSLFQDYQSLHKFLPDTCHAILDVGSGLGGIDVLLTRHYANGTRVDLLDGEADAPQMKLHRQTFNDMRVARNFLVKNGVVNIGTFNPNQVRNREARPQHKYDLIISLGSWCFHYPPDTYLDFVCEHASPDAVIVTDVRNEQYEWMQQLRSRLLFIGVAFTKLKFTRCAFAPKANARDHVP